MAKGIGHYFITSLPITMDEAGLHTAWWMGWFWILSVSRFTVHVFFVSWIRGVFFFRIYLGGGGFALSNRMEATCRVSLRVVLSLDAKRREEKTRQDKRREE